MSGFLDGVNGTVTANVGTTNGVALDSSLTTLNAKFGSVGQKTMAASAPITIASDQSALAISAVALPLPTGASTSGLQTTGNTSLSNIDTKTPTLVSGRQPVDGSGVTQPISATTLPLPTSASTSTLQSTTNTLLNGGLPTALGTGGGLKIDGSGTALPISGTVTANIGTTNGLALDTSLTSFSAKFGSLGQKTSVGSAPIVIASDQSSLPVTVGNFPATQAISATALPLPTGASTSALQTTGNSSLSSIDGKITTVNTGAVVISSSALPTGASTSALQTTGNSSLSSIDTKTPALVSGRVPVDPSGVTSPISMSTPVADSSLTTGTITAINQTVQLKINGYKSHAIVLTGTWTGTIVCETSADNTSTWITSSVHQTASGLLVLGILSPLILRDITSNGTYKTNSTGGNTHFRVRASTAITGTVNVSLVEVDSPHLTHFGQMSISQAVVASINNSSTTNLASNATFTGTSDSSLGIAGIQINIISDQPITISVQQSIDNVNWDINDTYLVDVGTGDSKTFQVTASFFRVTAINTGISTTTFFRLQTLLRPIVNPLPRSLTEEGNLKVAIQEPDGGSGRIRVGEETILFFDNIDGTTINLVGRWIQSQSVMTQTQINGNLTLNANSTLSSGAFSILSSSKQPIVLSEFPIFVQFKVRLIHQTNAVVEIGFGNVATTATPTDGIFIRIDSAGVLSGVINFNGTETVTNPIGTINSTTFYNIEVTILENGARFEITSLDGTDIDLELTIPVTQASPVSVGHLPIFARVYNSGVTSAAAQIIIGNVSVQQLDLNTNKPWAEQISSIGKSAILNPTTFTQSGNYVNNTIPATGTLSNVAAGYTTLGGLYKFATPATAETDYALFAYQVPIGFQLYVWSITCTAFITGANTATTAIILQWAVASDSSAVSLATAGTNPPLFLPIGMQQSPKTSIIGDSFSPASISFMPKTPIIVNSNRFFHIVLRIPLATAVANQIIRGSVTIEGYFE